MAERKKGGGSRPKAAIEASREHLGGGAGDNDGGEGEGIRENQDSGAQPSGDKTGEEGRREFLIPEDRREQLARARELDGDGEAGRVYEDAFWGQICAELGANSATIQPAEDILESGSFTAWPRMEESGPSTATNEADHAAALDRFEEIVAEAPLASETLAGDMRDIMLDIFRNRHKPWTALSAAEQRDVASAIDYAVKATLARAEALIASAGRSSITATLDKYADKGGEITATIKIVGADDQTVLALHRASGKKILIVDADSGKFTGQRADAVIQPDDPELAFDAGSDGARQPAPPDDSSDLADAADRVVDDDTLYRRAVIEVQSSRSASTSGLQRKLEIAFSVAERIMARMEAEGVVSAPDVTTKRGVLIPPPAGESGEPGDEDEEEAPAGEEED